MGVIKKHPYMVAGLVLLAWHYTERKNAAAKGLPNLFNMIGVG